MMRRGESERTGNTTATDAGTLSARSDLSRELEDAIGVTRLARLCSPDPGPPFLVRNTPAFVVLADVDEVLRAQVWPRADLRILRDGEVVSPTEYESLPGFADMAAVWDSFANGGHIVLQGIERRLPSLSRLCSAIASKVRGHAWVNAYVSGPGAGVFLPHADTHNVIVQQLVGSKHWSISHEIERETAIQPPSNGEFIELRPGSLLFLPAGVQHEARAHALSVHLAIGFRRSNWLELLQDATRVLPGPLLDAVVERSEPGHTQRLQLLLDHLSKALNHQLSARDVTSQLASPPKGLLAAINAHDVDQSCSLRRANSSTYVPRLDGDVLELTNGHRVIRMTALAWPVVSALLADDTVSISQLADVFEEPAWRKLTATLVTEGIAMIQRTEREPR